MPWSPLPSRQDASSDPVPLRESVDRVLAGLGAPTIDDLQTVHDQWNDLVGAGVADHAQPVSIEHGRLVVSVDDPAWASQLRWAEPDLDHAAWWMRRVRDDPSLGEQLGRRAQATILRDFSPLAVGLMIARRLDEIRDGLVAKP